MFGKTRKCPPNAESLRDKILLSMISKINLDIFISRARSTVVQNNLRVKQSLELSEVLDLDGLFDHTRQYPYFGHCGYKMSPSILLNLHRSSKHHTSHIKTKNH